MGNGVMRTYLLSVSLLLATGASALPADLGPAPVKAPMAAPMMAAAYNWSGFYVGVNGGGGWSTFTGVGGTIPGVNSLNASGAVAGGQVGGNYQIGNVVLGLEGSYDWADIRNTQIGPLGAGTLTLVTKNDYIATVAGRLGYAFDRVLIYGKGGAAFTRDRANANLTGPLPGTASGSFDRTGWLAGAGVEWAFWGNWSVKAEYDYMGFGAINEVITNTTGSLTASPATVKLNVQTAVVGINYKF
jgi:outer membrane immunogenic protein